MGWERYGYSSEGYTPIGCYLAAWLVLILALVLVLVGLLLSYN